MSLVLAGAAAYLLVPPVRKLINGTVEITAVGLDDSMKTGLANILLVNKEQRVSLAEKNKALTGAITADDLLAQILR